jgi:hypothetical protein
VRYLDYGYRSLLTTYCNNLNFISGQSFEIQIVLLNNVLWYHLESLYVYKFSFWSLAFSIPTMLELSMWGPGMKKNEQWECPMSVLSLLRKILGMYLRPYSSYSGYRTWTRSVVSNGWEWYPWKHGRIGIFETLLLHSLRRLRKFPLVRHVESFSSHHLLR